MRHSDKIELHQHVLEKLISQRNKVLWKLESSESSAETLETLQTLSRIVSEEIATRETLKKLYEEN